MKISQVYCLDSFKRLKESVERSNFADSFAGTVLARNLTAIDPKIFEKKYPELALINSGIVADNSGGYARKIQSLRLQDLGGFTTSGDASGNKGKISLAGEDSYLNVIVREAESIWSDDEIKEAELQNINLPSRYIQTHNKIYLREIDTIGLVGVDAKEGLLNHSGFTSGAASGAISTLTAQEMYDEISALITDQWNAVNNTPEYKANRVIMPVDVLNTISTTILNSAGSEMSVARAIMANFPGVEFKGSFRADDVGGASATVAYSNTEDVMKMRIPVPLTVGEIIKVGSFDYKIDSKYRIAGLDILENTGGRILTGL